ncbi:hypothetical protein Poli38472_002663 [Pythium oligandrum]|uniref:Polymerase nucleotidyl transferase domain-containing protein n=1 Tax=Pythium oligandrum TaxID=41045 RepID=A0A8K1FLD1_PYTOL|nr:hypothetical protein Poli38472_002663 [Pythium oligandrum]|eukprot:TMW63722.1 hypothetical protein Poli38472_002663 [Pythium oligandrum]
MRMQMLIQLMSWRFEEFVTSVEHEEFFDYVKDKLVSKEAPVKVQDFVSAKLPELVEAVKCEVEFQARVIFETSTIAIQDEQEWGPLDAVCLETDDGDTIAIRVYDVTQSAKKLVDSVIVSSDEDECSKASTLELNVEFVSPQERRRRPRTTARGKQDEELRSHHLDVMLHGEREEERVTKGVASMEISSPKAGVAVVQSDVDAEKSTKASTGSEPETTGRKRTMTKKRESYVDGVGVLSLPVPVWLDDNEYVNDTVIPVATRLGQEMVWYCEYTQARIDEVHNAIEDAIWNISVEVQAIWPDAHVACFGSFSTGLWLPSSDVDVVVMDIPADVFEASERAYGNGGVTPKKRPFVRGIAELEEIATRLRSQPWIKHIEVVRGAKVPVAKVVLADRDLRVDVSIENHHTRLGIEASVIVRDYITAIPVLHPLIMVLKQFLREKGLNNAFTGGLSSYCVSLMAVYLVERQGATNYSGADVGQLLLDFLEFYGTIFSYATTGISLKAEAFGEYFLDLTLGANGVPLLMPQLVIDDPVYEDGQHNAAAGAFAIARAIAAFENAFYAVTYHRPTKFTPTPLSQLVHWSGHAAEGAKTKPVTPRESTN